mgnify:FL=1
MGTSLKPTGEQENFLRSISSTAELAQTPEPTEVAAEKQTTDGKSERKLGVFAKSLERLENIDGGRGVKALRFLLRSEQNTALSGRELVNQVRTEYPLISDLESGLEQVIVERIGVAAGNLSPEEALNASERKKEEYRNAARELVTALAPLYAKYPIRSSVAAEAAMIEARYVRDNHRPNPIGREVEGRRLGEAVALLAEQPSVSVGDARVISQIVEQVLEEPSAAVTDSIAKIKDRSGLLALEARQRLAGLYGEEVSNGVRVESGKESEFGISSPELSEFVNFVKEHRVRIKERLLAGDPLSDAIYHTFYSRTATPRYTEDSPNYEQLTTAYDREITTLRERLSKNSKVLSFPTGGWLYTQVHPGLKKDGGIGRLYINVDPTTSPKIYEQVIALCAEQQLGIDTKIPLKGNEFNFNRADQMLLYFAPKDADAVMRVVSKVHGANISSFANPETAKFVSPVVGSDNKALRGVGFGEDPKVSGKSFGDIRSAVLAHIYRTAEEQGVELNDPAFDIQTVYEQACRDYNVDSGSPGYSANNSQFEDFRHKYTPQVVTPKKLKLAA